MYLLHLLAPTRTSFHLPIARTPLSYDLLSPDLDVSIKRMKSLSVDTVALVFYHFQDNDTSTRIFLDYSRYSADPIALAAAVRVIHKNGLKVLLKPHIGLNNNQFRGIIQPTPEYLAAYRAHILEWAAWATKHAVDVMCIGAELKGLEPAEKYWRTLVADVRGLFQGPVTYGMDACAGGGGGGGRGLHLGVDTFGREGKQGTREEGGRWRHNELQPRCNFITAFPDGAKSGVVGKGLERTEGNEFLVIPNRGRRK